MSFLNRIHTPKDKFDLYTLNYDYYPVHHDCRQQEEQQEPDLAFQPIDTYDL